MPWAGMASPHPAWGQVKPSRDTVGSRVGGGGVAFLGLGFVICEWAEEGPNELLPWCVGHGLAQSRPWRVTPGAATAPVLIVLVPSHHSLSEASEWTNSSSKPSFQPTGEWKSEPVGTSIHFQ